MIVRFEPVSMVVDHSVRPLAERLLDSKIDLIEHSINDSWMRDTGPTFVLGSNLSLEAITWRFNGWGAQDWARWDLDAELGSAVCRWAQVNETPSSLTNEGGGFHVNGSGTILLTETVQRDPYRNPGLSRADIEEELTLRLGVNRFIWFERGLAGDYGTLGTRGHVDLVAAFVNSSTCVAHLQPDADHPDYVATRANVRLLEQEGFRVVPVIAPAGGRNGPLMDWSYVNFYIGNGFVLMPLFNDPPRDREARETLQELFPGRIIEGIDARHLFRLGGGIHCITLQQPDAISRDGGPGA